VTDRGATRQDRGAAATPGARDDTTLEPTRSPAPAPAARRGGRIRRSLSAVASGPILNRSELALLGFIAGVCLAMTLWHPEDFATWSNAQNMARQGAVLGVVAIGQMFALLVGGFDISVGSLMGVASVIGVDVMIDHGLVAGLLAGIAAAGFLGLVNGILIARFGLSAFIVTLGMLSFARGFALEHTNGTPIIGPPESFAWFGARDWGEIPATVGIAAIVALLAALILGLTRMGMYFYAIGSNERAARLAGINVTRYKMLAYVLSGALAGVAGLMLSSRVVSGQPSLGEGYELQSIAVAVIGGVAIGGGKGRLQGVFLGLVLITVITSGLNIAEVSTFIQQMVIGALIVFAVLWDRFQTRGSEEEVA
jgi:ribose/xylose/arabinose/galactoside ABC-type transport system permease subunit